MKLTNSSLLNSSVEVYYDEKWAGEHRIILADCNEWFQSKIAFKYEDEAYEEYQYEKGFYSSFAEEHEAATRELIKEALEAKELVVDLFVVDNEAVAILDDNLSSYNIDFDNTNVSFSKNILTSDEAEYLLPFIKEALILKQILEEKDNIF